MSEEKEILVTKTNSSLGKYIVEKDTRFDVVNSEQIIKRLEQENKGLKEKIRYLNEGIERQVCFAENSMQYAEKYRQALEEIRDIAQIHQYFDPELLAIKGDIGQLQDLKMTEILKKCNEVLNDRD